MYITRDGMVRRTDIWREGKWLDLWSVVHLLSGASVGFVLYFLHFGATASIMLALFSFISYEMWEIIVKIEETPTNRFMDVVVGMVSFLPTFFLAPLLSDASLFIVFGMVLTANIIMGVFGWIASHKAAPLEERLREKYVLHQERVRERKLRRKLRRGRTI